MLSLIPNEKAEFLQNFITASSFNVINLHIPMITTTFFLMNRTHLRYHSDKTQNSLSV